MSTSVRAAAPRQKMRADDDLGANLRLNPAKVAIGLLGMVVVVWALANLFLAFGYYPQWFGNKVVIGLLAIIGGVGGAAVLFFFLNMFVEGLPQRLSEGVIPYAFLLPGLGLVGLMLIYPTFQTINYSFANSDSTAYIGLQNYKTIFSDSEFWSSIVNNVLWLLIVPAVTVALGIMVAVLADKLSATGEKVAKSLIFLPMAISFVGATAIWGLIYAYNNPGQTQTGLLNAIVVGLGGEPQTWLQISTAKLNSILLMVILVWLQVGFSMVLLSSAIKGVPEDTLEAARIDGASEVQIFFRVIIPQIRGTIITVFVTVFILVLKVFDLVYVTTNGSYGTNVIANLFFNKLFAASEAGQATAIVVVLLLAVTPLIWFQIRHFKEEEASR
ncbi:carbohydrate ABC transporter permease [Terracoccus luteus]|jgi:alpha-glucoside transport system permease protein|uniref:Alpha-glucoside transport system permease protein n=1 Tax=Terracoccus luteus TaxID=53356 RepID=A0A495XVT6_9MICO|nr:sugar ABC transporter permease [Terracoccus luteus]MBB2985930.1 alpha-glucoside transport system permease protein [Terracoccus luteus]MCP2171582.1 alpha-glucoside transport system permease protein [Terracoccus luteus]RKT78690.1 alpha-glucoside transport system permease protein [Terracoccus luteus]